MINNPIDLLFEENKFDLQLEFLGKLVSKKTYNVLSQLDYNFFLNKFYCLTNHLAHQPIGPIHLDNPISSIFYPNEQEQIIKKLIILKIINYIPLKYGRFVSNPISISLAKEISTHAWWTCYDVGIPHLHIVVIYFANLWYLPT